MGDDSFVSLNGVGSSGGVDSDRDDDRLLTGTHTRVGLARIRSLTHSRTHSAASPDLPLARTRSQRNIGDHYKAVKKPSKKEAKKAKDGSGVWSSSPETAERDAANSNNSNSNNHKDAKGKSSYYHYISTPERTKEVRDTDDEVSEGLLMGEGGAKTAREKDRRDRERDRAKQAKKDKDTKEKEKEREKEEMANKEGKDWMTKVMRSPLRWRRWKDKVRRRQRSMCEHKARHHHRADSACEHAGRSGGSSRSQQELGEPGLYISSRALDVVVCDLSSQQQRLHQFLHQHVQGDAAGARQP
jgi:hypothetical protein